MNNLRHNNFSRSKSKIFPPFFRFGYKRESNWNSVLKSIRDLIVGIEDGLPIADAIPRLCYHL